MYIIIDLRTIRVGPYSPHLYRRMHEARHTFHGAFELRADDSDKCHSTFIFHVSDGAELSGILNFLSNIPMAYSALRSRSLKIKVIIIENKKHTRTSRLCSV